MEHADGGRALQGSNDDQTGPNALSFEHRSPGRDTMEEAPIRNPTLSSQGKRRLGLAARRRETRVSLEYVRTRSQFYVRASVVKITMLYYAEGTGM